ncbi:MAG TPA: PQQ-binding-like beta-propeller repeat protein [Planctomycetaceae bacterium]|nr:PQQ-binding-like beta-propeller repeat protein [Planctomycetaceae bacterium]
MSIATDCVCRRTTLRMVLAILVLIASATRLPAQQMRQNGFQAAMSLDIDNAAVRKVAAAEEHIEAQQWSEAIDILRQVSEAHGDHLMPAGSRRFLSARTYCQILLAAMPAAGRKVFREQVDPLMKKYFESGRNARDEDLLKRVVQQGFASSYGDDALLLLGDLSWERGDWSLARGYWEKILPPAEGAAASVMAYPDTDLDLAGVHARLILGSLAERNLVKARRALRDFAARHGDVQGTLFGRKGKFVEILERTVADAESWKPLPAENGLSTFAGNYRQDAVLPQAVDVGAPQWTAPLHDIRFHRPGRLGAMQTLSALAYFPVVFDNVVLVNDEESIYAFELQTGKAWPEPNEDATNEQDRARLYPPVVGEPFRLFTANGADEQARISMNAPRFTMTVDQGRLYARLGSVAPRTVTPVNRERSSRLICLDLARSQGKLIWEKSSADMLGEKWSFEGAPIVVGGDVYIGLHMQDGQHTQINAACFDSATGELRWNRKICAGPNGPALSQQLLTLGENALYYATDLGSVAALDPHDGTLKWVVSYPRQEDDEARNDPWTVHHGLTPCVFHEGKVYAAPGDANRILAIDAENGVLQWERELDRQVKWLLGVGQNNLIASGDRLWFLDSDTGRVVHIEGGRDPEAFGYGRGLLVENLVYWPLHDEILVLDQRTGRRVQPPISLSGKHATGGNLAIVDGLLLVAESSRLVAYSEYGRMIRRFEQEVSAHPESPELRLQLARVEESALQFEFALDEYRKAIELSAKDPQSGTLATARTRLRRLLVQMADEAAGRDDFSQASVLLAEAAEVIGGPSCMRCLLRLADVQAEAGNPRAALQSLDRVLASADAEKYWTRDSEGREMTIARMAQRRMTELIAAHGPDVFADFAERARAEIKAAAAGADLEGLRRIAERNPHIEGVSALLTAGGMLARTGKPHAASEAYQLALARAALPEQRAQSLAGTARALEDLQFWRLARERWAELGRLYPEVALLERGQRTPAGALAAAHLANAAYTTEPASENFVPPLPWVRRWERPLANGAKLLFPEGLPPAQRFASLLIDWRGLTCLNPADASMRWNLDLETRAAWAGFVGDRLLIGMPDAIRAVAPASGETLWDWRLRAGSASTASASLSQDDSAGWGGAYPLLPAPTLESARGPLVAFRTTGSAVIAQQADGSLWTFDALDGRLLWQFDPAAGRIQKQWACQDDRIVLQTLRPARLMVLDTRDGRTLMDVPASATAWIAQPAIVGGAAVTIGPADHIQGDTLDGSLHWVYNGPLTQANASPAMLSNGAHLLIVIDGDTLVKLNPLDGRTQWRRWLGNEPVGRAHQLACLDDESVYIASTGVLRCVSLADGSERWQQPLGPRNSVWKTSLVGSILAVAPQRLSGRPPFVELCEARSGRPIERLWFRGAGEHLDVYPWGAGAVVAAEGRLFGLATE